MKTPTAAERVSYREELATAMDELAGHESAFEAAIKAEQSPGKPLIDAIIQSTGRSQRIQTHLNPPAQPGVIGHTEEEDMRLFIAANKIEERGLTLLSRLHKAMSHPITLADERELERTDPSKFQSGDIACRKCGGTVRYFITKLPSDAREPSPPREFRYTTVPCGRCQTLHEVFFARQEHNAFSVNARLI